MRTPGEKYPTMHAALLALIAGDASGDIGNCEYTIHQISPLEFAFEGCDCSAVFVQDEEGQWTTRPGRNSVAYIEQDHPYNGEQWEEVLGDLAPGELSGGVTYGAACVQSKIECDGVRISISHGGQRVADILLRSDDTFSAYPGTVSRQRDPMGEDIQKHRRLVG